MALLDLKLQRHGTEFYFVWQERDGAHAQLETRSVELTVCTARLDTSVLMREVRCNLKLDIC